MTVLYIEFRKGNDFWWKLTDFWVKSMEKGMYLLMSNYSPLPKIFRSAKNIQPWFKGPKNTENQFLGQMILFYLTNEFLICTKLYWLLSRNELCRVNTKFSGQKLEFFINKEFFYISFAKIFLKRNCIYNLLGTTCSL